MPERVLITKFLGSSFNKTPLVWTPAVVPLTALNTRSCDFLSITSKIFTFSWSIVKISFSLTALVGEIPITPINSTPVWATILVVNLNDALEIPTAYEELFLNPSILVDNPLTTIRLPLIKLWGVVTTPTTLLLCPDGTNSTLDKLVEATLIVLTFCPPILLTVAWAFLPPVPVLSKTTLSSIL